MVGCWPGVTSDRAELSLRVEAARLTEGEPVAAIVQVADDVLVASKVRYRCAVTERLFIAFDASGRLTRYHERVEVRGRTDDAVKRQRNAGRGQCRGAAAQRGRGP